MTTVIFDTLQFVKGAKEAGFTIPQAEFQAETLSKFFNDGISIKHDVSILKHDLKALRHDLKRDMRELKKDLIITMGGMIAAAVVILPAIFKLINFI